MKRLTNLTAFIFIIALATASAGKAVAQKNYSSNLWEEGKGEYKGYRIPAIVISTKGTVLAFAEGRNDGGDSGDIDLLLKRSDDNGKTWSKEILIWNDGQNTCGNPCPVVDQETGRIWLLTTWNYGKDHEAQIVTKKSEFPRKVFICYSDDDGLTWSKPADLTSTCKDPSWGWYATGPGFGIQLKNGKYNGRLVIPANHSYDDPNGNVRKGPYGYGAHVLISDDHGKTWKMSTPIRPGCNESQVTELSDATLLMNMRSYNGKTCRAISLSSDGGETWSVIEHDYQLVESVCQASILNFGNYKGSQIYLFSNPAVTTSRSHITIKYSYNNCKDWQGSVLIDARPSAYSCLAKLPNGNIGILYEAGNKNAYETIRFMSISPKNIIKNLDMR